MQGHVRALHENERIWRCDCKNPEKYVCLIIHMCYQVFDGEKWICMGRPKGKGKGQGKKKKNKSSKEPTPSSVRFVVREKKALYGNCKPRKLSLDVPPILSPIPSEMSSGSSHFQSNDRGNFVVFLF